MIILRAPDGLLVGPASCHIAGRYARIRRGLSPGARAPGRGEGVVRRAEVDDSPAVFLVPAFFVNGRLANRVDHGVADLIRMAIREIPH